MVLSPGSFQSSVQSGTSSALTARIVLLQQHLQRLMDDFQHVNREAGAIAELLLGPEVLHPCCPDDDPSELPVLPEKHKQHINKGVAKLDNAGMSRISDVVDQFDRMSLARLSAAVDRPAHATVEGHRSRFLPSIKSALTADAGLHRSSTAVRGGQLQNLFGVALPNGRNQGRVFADAESIKDRMQERMITYDEQDGDTYDEYQEDGHRFSDIARSDLFQGVSFGMVVFSSVWMAIEIDADGEGGTLNAAMAHTFCSYFLFELSVQLLAYKDKRRALTDSPFMFDALLVVLILLETWVLPVLNALLGTANDGGSMRIAMVFRLLRFLKVLRLGKVLRQLPELLIIIRGVLMAYKGISFTILLIAIIIYAGGLVFRVLLEGSALGEARFKTVPASMGTLLVEATLSGSKGGPLMREAFSEHAVYAVLLLAYVVLANITMMGVLGGLLVQAVKTVTEVEKAESDLVHLIERLNQIWYLALQQDTNGDSLICLEEFRNILDDKATADVLRSADVDLESLTMSSGFIFENSGTDGKLDRKGFMEFILDHRSKQEAKVKDHIETRRYMHSQFKTVLPRVVFQEWAQSVSSNLLPSSNGRPP